MAKTWTAALVAAFVLTLTACNTVEGAGKDIDSAAKEVDKEL